MRRWLAGILAAACIAALAGCPNFAEEATKPDIAVSRGGSLVASGSSIDINPTAMGVAKDVSFTIENRGKGDLQLTGAPAVVLSGADASMFSVLVQPGAVIGVGGSAAFTVRFFPTDMLNRSVTVTIASNDPDQGTFTFSLTRFTAPEITVKQGTTEILSGGAFDFGPVSRSTFLEVTFTVRNLGPEYLNLTGATRVDVGGADAADFVVTSQPSTPIAPDDGHSDFTIRFTPSRLGSHSADVTILSNDADEPSYTFSLAGSGIAPAILVEEGPTEPIAPGSTHNAGSAQVVTGYLECGLTIRNTGTDQLVLTGAPFVTIAGAASQHYWVTTQPTSPIPPSGTTTFVIAFLPTVSGTLDATVNITSNDLENGTYQFTMRGTGTGSWSAPGTISIFAVGTRTFTMGKTGVAAAEPEHSVTLTVPYAMGVHEVTSQQFCDVMLYAIRRGYAMITGGDIKDSTGTTTYCDIASLTSPGPIEGTTTFIQPKTGFADHPVSGVTWHGALAWCNFLSEIAGKPAVYDLGYWGCDWTKNGYRLPTEAEWEYAARPDGRTYPWGESIDGHWANYSGSGDPFEAVEPGTTPVGYYNGTTHGTFTTNDNRSSSGMYDMAGNVGEWCWDWYIPYTSDPQTDPRGAATGMQKIIRGGSWVNSATGDLRAFNRSVRDVPGAVGTSAIGMRVVLSQ